MKTSLAILTITALLLCGCSTPSQKGTFTLENGMGEKCSVEYDIAELQYDSFITQIATKQELQTIAEKASSEAHMMCKHMPTYEPKSLSFMINHDTITTIFIFNAKNSFGVPSSEMLISKFKGTTFIEGL